MRFNLLALQPLFRQKKLLKLLFQDSKSNFTAILIQVGTGFI